MYNFNFPSLELIIWVNLHWEAWCNKTAIMKCEGNKIHHKESAGSCHTISEPVFQWKCLIYHRNYSVSKWLSQKEELEIRGASAAPSSLMSNTHWNSYQSLMDAAARTSCSVTACDELQWWVLHKHQGKRQEKPAWIVQCLNHTACKASLCHEHAFGDSIILMTSWILDKLC